METFKRLIMLVLTAFVLLVFTEKAYGEEKGKLVYYKDEEFVEEEVFFWGNSIDRNCFLLLKVLLNVKCESLPEGIDICYTFFDEDVMWVGLNDEFEKMEDHEKGFITEQITKTACSLKGVESIMICVEGK
ncbi:MAG: GerMN domain-containing protein [Firmicutes bacterium]|nr:GerMN domain-containing protein [Bacillota bacterium]